MEDFRYLWAFSPQSGRVHLYNEDEHHPAEVPTHESLANDLGEVGLYHGYAYRIPGGWRVFDYDHKVIADPFVRRHVVEALNKHKSQPRMPEPEPQPDFGQQLHYRAAAAVPSIMYHGSTPEKRGDIAARGLTPNEGLIYLTPDYDEALTYGPSIWRVQTSGLRVEPSPSLDPGHFVCRTPIPRENLSYIGSDHDYDPPERADWEDEAEFMERS